MQEEYNTDNQDEHSQGNKIMQVVATLFLAGSLIFMFLKFLYG